MPETNSAPFNGGMNSDNSPIYQPKSTYVDALNIEFINDKSQGSVGISNSKGNKFQKAIPDVGKIYKLILSDTIFGVINLTINGVTVAFTNSLGVTHKDLYDFIKANFSITELNVYYDDIKVIVVPISPYVLSVTVDNNSILIGGDASAGGTGPYIAAQTDLQPIGYGIINDDIYIITTNCIDKNPQSTGNGIGQIWKLAYDNIGFDAALSTIDLIYSADMSLSTYHHIPQTAIVTRYENSFIQRIYFTDNYNRVRQLNVKDPQAFALDVSLLELIPAVDFDVPILSEIHEGGVATVKVGVWQMAYRFKNTTGSVTAFSALSNIVPIVNHYESISILSNSYNEFRGYTGDAYGTTTTKVVSWTINNLDPDFDRIECVLLIREQKDSVPTIYSFNEESISGRESITITVDGDILAGADTTTLTLAEFLTLSGYFTHAKTLATKDNRLIAGNIRSASADIDFDARAYRFPASNYNFSITETGVVNSYDTTLFTVPSDWSIVEEESDAINITDKYRRGSTTLGGDGPNISYEFVSVALVSDVANNLNNTNFNFLNSSITAVSGFRSTVHDIAVVDPTLDLNVNSSDIDGLDILQEYNLALPQITYRDMKYPQYSSNYWGYQQNEIYRIGIQFYDKAKNPYFVKWIGDIKFPDINDSCIPANNLYYDGTQTGQTSYIKSFVVTNGIINPGKCTAFITQLGLKVNVSIPAELTEIISGYSIVRVKREESDKTVIAEGIITSVGDQASSPLTIYYTPDSLGNEFMNGYSAFAEPAVCYFNTPNHLISGVTEPRAGDKLNIRRAFQSAASLNATDLANGAILDYYYIYRLYNDIATATQLNINLAQVLNLGIGGTGTSFTSGYSVSNGDNLAHSNGNQCYFLDLGGYNLQNYTGLNFKLYATIDRVLTNQYGGNTYGDRANNEYILCSHFRPVKNNSAGYSDSPLVFGGDTMNYHIDMQRNIKNWATGPANKCSSTFIFPAGSCANIGFRYGTFINYNLLTDNGATASGTETYDYNTAYSSQNDIVKFFPKPDPFISNDEFPNRFRSSEIKINGELADSWSDFKENNYWDVEGTYGPINSSLIMADKLYFWQDRAFGIMQVNPQTMVQSTDGVALQVGTGLPLQRHDYISTVTGTQHQSSTISSDRRLYWLDINTKKIHTFDGSGGLSPFSDIKGEYAYLNENLSGQIQNIDKPLYRDNDYGINGVAATYDYKRHKAIFTFHSGIKGVQIGDPKPSPVQTSFTFVINELTNTFTTRHSFLPRMYINDFKHIISGDPEFDLSLKNLYLHDEGFYGTYYDKLYPCYIKFIVNDLPLYNKVFDNIIMDTQSKDLNNINQNNDTWSSIRVTNDYQNTDIIPLVYNANIKRKERNWQLAFPRNRVLYTGSNSPNIFTDLSLTNKPFGERLRDKYISIELTYNNLLNNQLITNNIKSLFRQSSR